MNLRDLPPRYQEQAREKLAAAPRTSPHVAAQIEAALNAEDDFQGVTIVVPPRASSTPAGFHINFFAYGVPKPGGSKRAFAFKGKNGKLRANVVEDCERNKTWREAVKEAALAALKAAGSPALTTAPLDLYVAFYMPRPKGHRGARGLRPSAPKYPTTKPDATKLLRSTEDALTGIVWGDDAQIVTQRVLKLYADDDRPGAHIVIGEAK